MCCAVRNPLLVLGFYIKLIDDITLAASTSLLSVLLSSFWSRTHSCHSFLRQTAGRTETYAHLGEIFCLSVILNMHVFSRSTKTFLSFPFVYFVSPSPYRQSHTYARAPTPLGPNHCKQQIVVNTSPRSACCCVAKRKKKQKKTDLCTVVFLINLLGVLSKKERRNECCHASAHMPTLSDR